MLLDRDQRDQLIRDIQNILTDLEIAGFDYYYENDPRNHDFYGKVSKKIGAFWQYQSHEAVFTPLRRTQPQHAQEIITIAKNLIIKGSPFQSTAIKTNIDCAMRELENLEASYHSMEASIEQGKIIELLVKMQKEQKAQQENHKALTDTLKSLSNELSKTKEELKSSIRSHSSSAPSYSLELSAIDKKLKEVVAKVDEIASDCKKIPEKKEPKKGVSKFF